MPATRNNDRGRQHGPIGEFRNQYCEQQRQREDEDEVHAFTGFRAAHVGFSFEDLNRLAMSLFGILAILRIRQSFLAAAEDGIGLPPQCRPKHRIARVMPDRLDRFQQAERHGRVGSRGLANLVERVVDDSFHGRSIRDDPQSAVVVVTEARRNLLFRQGAKRGAETLDAVDRRERIVHARRQGTHRDFDELVDRELDVLRQSATGAEIEGRSDRFHNTLVDFFGRPGLNETSSLKEELPGPLLDGENEVVFLRQRHQSLDVDRLQIVAHQRGDRRRVAIEVLRQIRLRHLCLGVGLILSQPLGVESIDRAMQFTTDAGDHVLGLNRFGGVVNEIDEHAEADE